MRICFDSKVGGHPKKLKILEECQAASRLNENLKYYSISQKIYNPLYFLNLRKNLGQWSSQTEDEDQFYFV